MVFATGPSREALDVPLMQQNKNVAVPLAQLPGKKSPKRRKLPRERDLRPFVVVFPRQEQDKEMAKQRIRGSGWSLTVLTVWGDCGYVRLCLRGWRGKGGSLRSETAPRPQAKKLHTK